MSKLISILLLCLWGTIVSSQAGMMLSKKAAAGGAPDTTHIELEIFVSASLHDVEQQGTTVFKTSGDLELTQDGGTTQTLGIQMQNTSSLPQGVEIVDCWIQFESDQAGSDAASMEIFGEDVDASIDYDNGANDVVGRVKVAGLSFIWTPPTWANNERTPAQTTVNGSNNLAPILEAIVGRTGYVPGNRIGFMIYELTNPEKRRADSYDEAPGAAPSFYIKYVQVN